MVMLVVRFKRKQAWYISSLNHAKSTLKYRFKLNLGSKMHVLQEFWFLVVGLIRMLVLSGCFLCLVGIVCGP